MESTQLIRWLLTDDIGLGKTMSALSRLILYTKSQQTEENKKNDKIDDVQPTDNPDPTHKVNANPSITIQICYVFLL